MSELIDELLELYAPKEETFDITLQKGTVLKFKYVTDSDEHEALQSGAREFVKMIRDEDGFKRLCATNKGWKDIVVKNDDSVGMCYTLAHTIVSPKLDEFDFMTFAKRIGPTFNYIAASWKLALLNLRMIAEVEDIEASKKNSVATDSSD